MKIVNKIYEENNIKGIDKTIVSIADLHLNEETTNELLFELLDNIQSLNPDYITFLGDITNTCQFLENKKIKEMYNIFMHELSTIAKTLVILGNHDLVRVKGENERELSTHDKLQYFDGFKDTIFLNNSNYKDGNINFIGYAKSLDGYLSEWNGINRLINELNYLDERIKIIPKNFNILLSHSPINLLNDIVIERTELLCKINLILAGHTHNGLVPNYLEGIIPKNKGLNFKGQVVDNVRNEISHNGIHMIINGGITKIDQFRSKLIKNMNFLYNPEIDEIKIKSLHL